MQLTPEQVQSINVLLSGCQVAQRRGAYSLQEAHTLQGAIDSLVPREEQERQMQEAMAAAQAQQDGEFGQSESSFDESVETAGEESSDDGSGE